MNRSKAREILGDMIHPDNSLYELGHYICWNVGDDSVCLDDDFSVDELEAIVWWIRNNTELQPPRIK